ncbi:MAG: Abi family protein, partial [Bacteroidales bacterium]|nr:Abi family protein [Bacteroidales bacterium]
KFPSQAYLSIKKKGPIKRHHTKYIGGYAPAWKSIEYMTLGNLEILYDSLLLDGDKRMISLHYGEPAIGTFKSYLTTIREVRNICAHGSFLFGMKLTKGIRSGMACRTFPNQSQQSFQGALYVIDYLLKTVSKNRTRDMWNDIFVITKRLYSKAPMTQTIIEKQTGIILPENFTENESFANTFRD